MKKINKYCYKCGNKLVKDNIHHIFNEKTGKRIELANLICPMYPKGEDTDWSQSHSAQISYYDLKEQKVMYENAGYVDYDSFPTFRTKRKQRWWDNLLDAETDGAGVF